MALDRDIQGAIVSRAKDGEWDKVPGDPEISDSFVILYSCNGAELSRPGIEPATSCTQAKHATYLFTGTKSVGGSNKRSSQQIQIYKTYNIQCYNVSY